MGKSGGALRVLAVPKRGLHGHMNPMLCFCKSLASKSVEVTMVVTKGWLHEGAGEGIRFLEADETEEEEEEAMQRLLDVAEPPPNLIVADSFLDWAVAVGEARSIPVASFWPASASSFTTAFHSNILLDAYSFPLDLSGDAGEERTDLIPGIPSIRLSDLPGKVLPNNKLALGGPITKVVSAAAKAQCIIFRTTRELEEPALTALRRAVSVPVFPIGPAIPFSNNTVVIPDYIKWLDNQPHKSVLYVSLGTYLQVGDAQMEELAYGLKDSGVPFLWIAPHHSQHIHAIFKGHIFGKVVNWCDQMKVLRHSSVGGFLTHCGWNSTVEAAFAAVPALTFPLGLDQTLNTKLMVEDWGIGWRVKTNLQDLVLRDEISELLCKFMDSESVHRKELDGRCNEFKKLLLLGIDEDGSTSSLDEFLLNLIENIVN